MSTENKHITFLKNVRANVLVQDRRCSKRGREGGSWINWSFERSPHFQFTSPGSSPRPAHCSGRTPGQATQSYPTEKPEPGLSRASGRRRSAKIRKRRCARRGWKASGLGEPRAPGPGANVGSLGGPSVPTPPLARQFPRRHTEPARGAGRGLRRVPWRPVPASRARERAPQRRPAHRARCAFPPEGALPSPARSLGHGHAHPGDRSRGAHPAPCMSGITRTPV